jgi:hypothetical protein
VENSLLKALRPGSRTVLCHPSDSEFAVELARHGFRLMVIHEDPDFLQSLKKELRSQGLSSLLMGTTQAAVNQVPSLAKGFYELILLSRRSEMTMNQMKFALETGGLLIRPSAQGEVDLTGLQSVDLPAGYVGGRVGP